MASQPSPLTLATHAALKAILDAPPSFGNLQQAMRYLAKWRTEIVANTLLKREGSTVLSGPFKGLDYAVRAAEGSRTARLIGAYEASLHPVIEEIIARAPEVIIDIGSAEGYYAVGMARRLPQTRVLARDASLKAQDLCRKLAEINGVADRVEIGGLFEHADFALCQTAKTVVICDIEGAEDQLLDPVAAPGLCHCDILVECHPATSDNLVERLKQRFAASHHVRQIDRKLDDSGLPDWMEELSDLDRLVTLWEWRGGPTPWLWMEKK